MAACVVALLMCVISPSLADPCPNGDACAAGTDKLFLLQTDIALKKERAAAKASQKTFPDPDSNRGKQHMSATETLALLAETLLRYEADGGVAKPDSQCYVDLDAAPKGTTGLCFVMDTQSRSYLREVVASGLIDTSEGYEMSSGEYTNVKAEKRILHISQVLNKKAGSKYFTTHIKNGACNKPLCSLPPTGDISELSPKDAMQKIAKVFLDQVYLIKKAINQEMYFPEDLIDADGVQKRRSKEEIGRMELVVAAAENFVGRILEVSKKSNATPTSKDSGTAHAEHKEKDEMDTSAGMDTWD